MNIVFWFLILLALAGVWYLFAPFFSKIGRTVKDETAYVKEEIQNDYEEDNSI